MAEDKFKRNVAYKSRIGDLLVGKPIMDSEKFSFLELGNNKIVRVNLVGNIVDKFENTGEKKYIFITLDDGSGQISLKLFGEDTTKFSNFYQGQTVLVIGLIRFFNDIYVAPEIIRELNPKFLLIRKLEVEKKRNRESIPPTREKAVAVKDKILGLIKDSENDGGIDSEVLLMKIRDASPEILHQEIKKLLEEGIIFEP